MKIDFLTISRARIKIFPNGFFIFYCTSNKIHRRIINIFKIEEKFNFLKFLGFNLKRVILMFNNRLYYLTYTVYTIIYFKKSVPILTLLRDGQIPMEVYCTPFLHQLIDFIAIYLNF